MLTGDTLFIGDVGRPDLMSSIGLTREELADKLYDSLHGKLMTLPDTTRVYPAHGAGSSCGKSLSSDRWSTIGEQKATNCALRTPDRAAFIALVTEGQPPAPGYFAYDAMRNRQNRDLLDEKQSPTAMTHRQVMAALDRGAILVDGRNPEDFARGHVRGAINVGLNGRYAEFAGSVLEPDVDVVMVTDPGDALEAKNRFARIGFDRVVGYLAEPLDATAAHPNDVQVVTRVTAGSVVDPSTTAAGVQLLDVRNPGETASGTVPGAITIPLGELMKRLDELDATAPTIVYCASGYRSSIAASLLRRRGFCDVSDVAGGYASFEGYLPGC